MKTCTTCGEHKPICDFHRSSYRKDGVATKCKVCTRLMKRKAEEANKERVRARRRESNKRNRESRTRYMNEYRARNPAIKVAWRQIEYGLRIGSVIRPSACHQCKIECKPEAAHTDYSRPLDVLWLCRKCHIEFDRIRGEGPLKHRDEQVTAILEAEKSLTTLRQEKPE